MFEAKVIIGGGYGDEGKGLATDYFTAPLGGDALVVRFNGGAQAGHTVVMEDGRRHIFSHIGSGGFSSSATFLSRYFVCHPILFLRELAILRGQGLAPLVYVDPRCAVTTPFDMMINQELERSRQHGRHGSCGLGFGETIERHERGGFELYAGDLGDRARTLAVLIDIRDRYAPARMRELGLDRLPDGWRDDALLERFADDAWRFNQVTELADPRIMAASKQVVFEGAQGLLLDMDIGYFPHVTRSHTGLRNVAELAAQAGIDLLDISYITRWYATRHGAGPMRHELARTPFTGMVDQTNLRNPWQGRLRFGWLDIDELASGVAADLNSVRGGPAVSHEWFVTWVDKAPGALTYAKDGKLARGDVDALARALATRTRARVVRYSAGETRRGVVGDGAVIRAA